MEHNTAPVRNQDSLESAGITLRLDGFEGPLDLLLHLIKKEEVDIWNIPIAKVTEQYLQYLDLMKDLNINLAGEWVAMAATLIYIKSRMLLPSYPSDAPEGDAEDDPRTELVYQLLEHQKFKNAAQMLRTREEVENAVWSRPPPEVVEESKHVVSVSLFELVHAFQDVVNRFEAERNVELDQEQVTVEEKLLLIRQTLLVHERILFTTLFVQAPSKRHLIVTFLALLELVRLHEAWVFQERTFEDIYVAKPQTDS